VRRKYQFLLALPFLVPLLLSPLWLLSGENGVGGVILVFFFYSLLIGGIPYLILAIAMVWWMRNKEERSIRICLLLSPLLMIACTAVCLAIYTFVADAQPTLRETIEEYLEGMLFVSVFILLFGYLYVALGFTLIWIDRRPAEETGYSNMPVE